MYTVKDCTSHLMNMNSITTPVYTAEKLQVNYDNSTYFFKILKSKLVRSNFKINFFNGT